MKILGIETSCDETAAAVVEDGTRLLSNVVSSQMLDFAKFGGVIPEIAARSHIEVMLPVVDKALTEARCQWDDIDAIAVTYAPGLIGSLLIGTLAARTLAFAKNKPLYPIHHVEGHVYANFLLAPAGKGDGDAGEEAVASASRTPRADEVTRRVYSEQASTAPSLPAFPLLALIVSGGHTQIALFRDHGDYVLLGQAQDDAVGEAFDKVAKLIGLPYPGGISISNLAPQGNPHAFAFPKASLACPPGCTHEINRVLSDAERQDTKATIRGGRGEVFARDRCHRYDFSFSGLKTAVLRAVQAAVGQKYDFPSHQLPELVSDSLRADVAASFQHIAVETLVDKVEKAYHDFSPASVVIAGGVAANQELRRQLSERLPLHIEYAPINLCTDNAAMIASLGYFYAEKNQPTDPRELEVMPSLSMTKTAWAQQR